MIISPCLLLNTLVHDKIDDTMAAQPGTDYEVKILLAEHGNYISITYDNPGVIPALIPV